MSIIAEKYFVEIRNKIYVRVYHNSNPMDSNQDILMFSYEIGFMDCITQKKVRLNIR